VSRVSRVRRAYTCGSQPFGSASQTCAHFVAHSGLMPPRPHCRYRVSRVSRVSKFGMVGRIGVVSRVCRISRVSRASRVSRVCRVSGVACS
jgi:hypothetical protein